MEMYSWASWIQFVCVSFYAILAIIISTYIPGSLINKPTGKTDNLLEHIISSLGIGLALWVWQGVIFGYLQIRGATYIYLFVCLFLWIYFKVKEKRILHFHPVHIGQYHWVIGILLLVGVFGQVNRFLPSGFIFPKGIYMYTVASDDAFWHLALTNQIVNNFPPNEPGLYDSTVTNYHYWSNIIVAEFVRLFHIPLLLMQFVYIPLFASFMLGLISYVFLTQLGLSRLGKVFGLWLLYFASDIHYLTSFIMGRGFIFTVHPLEDGTMFWENPPRAFSFIFVLIGLVLLFRWTKHKDIRTGLIISLVFGSVVGFKVHTGIMIIGALFCFALYSIWKHNWKMLWIPILSFLLALFVYLPVNKNSGLPIFAPFEMARMTAAQEKLGLSFLELRRRIYLEHNNIPRQLEMDGIMFVTFFVSQFGLRNLGWIGFLSILGNYSYIGILILGGLVTSLIFGTLFIQPIAFADIFNAYLATSLLLWMGASVYLDNLVKRKSAIYIIILILVTLCLTLPRWLYKTYITPQQIFDARPAIWTKELEAMSYVRRHASEEDIMAIFNKGQWDSVFPYISVFTNSHIYLSGQTMLARHGIDFNRREHVIDTLATSQDSKEVIQLLDNEKITLLYFYGKPIMSIPVSVLPFIHEFSNESISIYRYTKIK